jgi:hypothetical protein
MSIDVSIQRLEYLLEVIPAKLSALNDGFFSQKTDPLKWSRKEILGHLIDSAANNHQRFIRIQYENEPVIFYDQNKWIEMHRIPNLRERAANPFMDRIQCTFAAHRQTANSGQSA